jgi:hypothetical protein
VRPVSGLATRYRFAGEENVRGAIEHWDSLLADDRGLEGKLPDLRRWLVDRELAVEGRPLCTVLRPHLIGEGDFAHQAEVAGHVISAVYKVRDALLADEELARDTLGNFREAVGALLELERRPAGDGAVMRLDSSLARTELHFIELNADTPQGMGHNDGIVEFFQHLDTFSRFSERFRSTPLRLEPPLLETLLAAWNEWGGTGKPRIATVSLREDPVRWTGLEIDTERFRRHGFDAVLCDAGELEFASGRLRHEGGEIDVVHRVLLTGECVARRDEFAALLDAVRAGAVCMVNPFRSELLGHKAIFALLTDPSHDFGFTATEREAIRTHVPWTRRLVDERTAGPDGNEVELVPHVRESRDRLVLKPSHDYGGHGVHLGWREDDAAWERTVVRALEEDYIVQRRVQLRREEYPTMAGRGSRERYFEDTDPFVFHGRVRGMLARLSPSEITNVHAAGSVVASFVVAPRA